MIRPRNVAGRLTAPTKTPEAEAAKNLDLLLLFEVCSTHRRIEAHRLGIQLATRLLKTMHKAAALKFGSDFESG